MEEVRFKTDLVLKFKSYFHARFTAGHLNCYLRNVKRKILSIFNLKKDIVDFQS